MILHLNATQNRARLTDQSYTISP